MNKTTRIFLAAMCSGVLLAGIGAGIAFGEYSSLEFRKLEAPQGAEPVQKSAELSVPEEGDVTIYTPDRNACTVMADESVPAGTVSISARCDAPADAIAIEGPSVVTYEPEYYGPDYDDYGEPDFDGDSYDDPDYGEPADDRYADTDRSDRDNASGATRPEPETITSIHVYPMVSGGGFEMLMHYKDQVLDGLKQGFTCIPPNYYESMTVEVRVNPVDLDRIQIL